MTTTTNKLTELRRAEAYRSALLSRAAHMRSIAMAEGRDSDADWLTGEMRLETELRDGIRAEIAKAEAEAKDATYEIRHDRDSGHAGLFVGDKLVASGPLASVIRTMANIAIDREVAEEYKALSNPAPWVDVQAIRAYPLFDRINVDELARIADQHGIDTGEYLIRDYYRIR